MDLLPFQSAASSQIASRFREYLRDPNAPTETRYQLVPFFQALSALTGAGKTLILADALERMREALSVEPVVLWVSKGKVVVEQTFVNLSTGKYRDLIPGYTVKALSECSRDDIEEGRGLLLLATVATFNQRDRERRIFKLSIDDATASVWDLLKRRETSDLVRRPLIVVYDEGHNLSDQQTDILLDLGPDAVIAATATPRLSARLGRILDRLKAAGWSDERLTTNVVSIEVVESGLVKSQVVVGGYVTAMEVAVDEMHRDMAAVERLRKQHTLAFRPKAIYVCSTNVAEGGVSRGQRDDPRQPFSQRKAPPILIWRYLTEQKKIPPRKIAVYCDLDAHRHFPLPDDFVLFNGGDADYANFSAGEFEHIIFNLGLQEGWDDPECYFAYIDKSMGSRVQVEQLIGRVLRQPAGQHFPDVRLNTASFYVRVDEKTAFPKLLAEVQRSLSGQAPQVNLSQYLATSRTRTRLLYEAKRPLTVPRVSVDASHARKEVASVMRVLHDYRRDQDNTRGKGARARVLQRIGDGKTVDDWRWIEAAGANRLTARSLFIRRVHSLYPRAINVCDVEHPFLDAQIEIGSVAAGEIEALADRVVQTFLTHCRLVQRSADTDTIGPVFAEPDQATTFKHSIHERYSDLNPSLELPFASALDRTKLPWARNPSQSGYSVPLLTAGRSTQFFPDFLIWKGHTVFALDTKGQHILADEASRKLLDIEQVGRGSKVVIRLISEGKWTGLDAKRDERGFTVWTMRAGRPLPITCDDVHEAVARSIR
jgi:type III restriction enzyme